MEVHITPRQAPVERLPTELKQLILSAITDVQSLKSAALSCPSFYHIFSGAESIITTHVLFNQLGCDVPSEAVAALESSRLRLPTKQGVHDFVTKYLRQRCPSPRSWTLRDALPVGKLHLSLRYFATRFANACLTKEPLRSATLTTPTPGERDRINRAFYRFEIFCNLFRKPNVVNSRDHRDLFFSNFSPWENEQLACIHDFLARQISPAFNDIAEHDVSWGEFNVDFDGEIDSPYMQHILSFGLEKLHQIAMAETYEARHTLLCPRPSPGFTLSFLYESLENANEKNDDLFLNEMTPGLQHTYIKTPFFSDPDAGSANIWRWAHEEETPSSFVYQCYHESLREWGYVMWDQSRLVNIGIFKSSWEPLEISRDARLEKRQEAERQLAYMRDSWREREKIYRSGGTGWWNWGDKSKIVWSSREMLPQEPYQIEPNSIDEAKEVLRALKLPQSVATFIGAP